MSEKFSTQELHTPVESTAVSPLDFGYEHTTTRAQTLLYNGKYVDSRIYEDVVADLNNWAPEPTQGEIYSTKALMSPCFWRFLNKKEKNAVRNCVMHLAVTRNVDLIPVSCNADGEQMYYVI